MLARPYQSGEKSREAELPPLRDGERLDQPTFHECYKAMPTGTRAELIGGVVSMPSPLKRPHGRIHAYLSWWLVEYQDATPGTETFDNASAILGSHSEPQPDSCLLILPPGKGQTRDEDDFIIGAPELVVEIAAGTKDLDLGAKKKDYEKAGVREYLVASLEENRVYWFSLRKGKFKEVPPGADGTYGSEAFPGLWLDPAALLRRDKKRLLEVLRQGLATPAHAAFVKRLAEK